MLLNIVLFIVVFCFYCCLIPSPKPTALDTFIPEVKLAFSPQFDPEPITVEPPTTPLNSPNLLALPPAKPRRLKHTATLHNPILITPNSEEQPVSGELPPIPENPTIRELREFIKNHNLHQLVKEKLGKSVSKCKKDELIKALTA